MSQDTKEAHPTAPSHSGHCRVCGSTRLRTFVNLGMVPLCQTYLREHELGRSETFYPLHATVCLSCFYVGLPEYVRAEDIFTEYAYLSSTSESWSRYAADSAVGLIEWLALDGDSQVLEMASNDGYLLQHFVKRGIPSLGIEPAANVAAIANERGVPTLPRFFNSGTARELRDSGKAADLLLAYNCLDHVPDINDVVAGMALIVKPAGVIQVELPHLKALIAGGQFDTIYHDRYSYLSLTSLHRVMSGHGLEIFDVEDLPTHGGSMRVRAQRSESAIHSVSTRVEAWLAGEEAAGLRTEDFYARFSTVPGKTKLDLLELLVGLKKQGKSIVAYGVPAKGNVLLNYCGIRDEFLDYLVDRSPYKQHKFSPGTHIEIHDVGRVAKTRPDYLLILPWNIKDEVMEQMASIRDWGGQFIVPIPKVEVVP